MKKKVPIKPTIKEQTLSWLYSIICVLSWMFLIIGAFHLISYYWYISNKEGIFSPESVKICVYLIAGSFLFLFGYKDAADKIFKVKR